MGFPGSSVVKNLHPNAEDMSSIRELGMSTLEKEMQPTSEFLPGKSHAQKRLADCSSWHRRVGQDLAIKSTYNQTVMRLLMCNQMCK